MPEIENVLEWKGRTGPFSIGLNPGVFSPTHTSRTLADALEIGPEDVVIDVGCGSGVLSFVAARLGAKRTYGCDLAEEAVEMAKVNAVALGLQDGTLSSRPHRAREHGSVVLVGGPAEQPRIGHRCPSKWSKAPVTSAWWMARAIPCP